MRANVAELVEAEFGIVVGQLERFKSNGWFAVGLTEAECPRCRSRMQGYRMPYTTKAGLAAWLKRAMEEGELKKAKAPVRYAWLAPELKPKQAKIF